MAEAKFKRGDSYGGSHVIPVTLLNDSGEALLANQLVEKDGDGIKALTSAGSLLGVCHEDIPDGEKGVVDLPIYAVYEITLASGGTFDSETDAPDFLSKITAAGSGEFESATGNTVCGAMVDQTASAGDTCRAILISASFSNPGTA